MNPYTELDLSKATDLHKEAMKGMDNVIGMSVAQSGLVYFPEAQKAMQAKRDRAMVDLILLLFPELKKDNNNAQG